MESHEGAPFHMFVLGLTFRRDPWRRPAVAAIEPTVWRCCSRSAARLGVAERVGARTLTASSSLGLATAPQPLHDEGAVELREHPDPA